MPDPTQRGRVVVRGNNLMVPPLLDSVEAQIIEVYDGFGEAMALLIRILSDDTWGLVTKGDEDWEAMKLRYGLSRLQPGISFKDAVDKIAINNN